MRIRFVILLWLCCTPIFATSHTNTIKVAIIDNFHFQPFISDSFGKNYIKGIQLEANNARKQANIIYHYKAFNYSRNNPLDIYNSIKNAKRWKPDVVIGPRNSNMFLLLKNSFKDTLVISPFATANQVYKLPSNFHTLALSNKYIAKAMMIFLQKRYPNHGVFTIVESDCTNCVSVAQAFKKLAKLKHITYHERSIDQEALKSISITKLLDQYHQGDIILLPNMAYFSGIMMIRIVNTLNKKGLIFFGGDGWGTWNNTIIGKMKARQPYIAYHFTPINNSLKDPVVKNFIQTYKKEYPKDGLPTGDAMLVGYKTLKSITCALKSKSFNNFAKNTVLKAFINKIHNNPNWFRSPYFAVYKITYQKNKLLTSIQVIRQPHYQCIK